MAASILFVAYGLSGVPINCNFMRAMLKTQTANYFLFQNDRWLLRRLSAGSKDLVLLQNLATSKTPSEYYFRFGIRHRGKWPPVVF
jgi:hypothetical protein